jgi:hypothetical protein
MSTIVKDARPTHRGVNASKRSMFMRTTTSVLLFICLQVQATGFSQQVSISGKELSLERVFSMLKSQTGYDVLYNPELLKTTRPVTLSVRNMDLKQVLELCAKDQPVDIMVRYNTLVVTPKKDESRQEKPEQVSKSARSGPVSGKVTSETGEPLFNASVTVKGTSRGVTTNENGIFIIDAQPQDVLVISIGEVTSGSLPGICRSTSPARSPVWYPFSATANRATTTRISGSEASAPSPAAPDPWCW